MSYSGSSTSEQGGPRSSTLLLGLSIAIIVAVAAFGAYLLYENPVHQSTSIVQSTSSVQAQSAGRLGPWNLTTGYPFSSSDLSCVVSGGFVYCVGGYFGTSPTSGQGDMNLTYYAPLSSSGVWSWTRTTDYPTGIQDESCVASSAFIYCVGGYVGSPNGHSSAVVYYAALSSSGIGKWSQTTPFPYPVSNLRCLTDSGYVYCISAHYNGTGFTDTSDAYFAPLSPSGVGTWVQTSGPATMTAGCSAIGGYVYCFGGGNCSPLPMGDCYSPSYFAPLSSSGIGTWKNTTELPTAGWAIYATAESYIYYLSVPIFFAQVSADGIGAWETTTNYPNSLSPAACASGGDYLYCVSAEANSSYYAQVGAPNPHALQLENPPPFPRADYLDPAWNGEGGCSVNGVGAPCFDPNIDDAVVFNCGAAAATSSGCRTTVVSPLDTRYNYDLTIWLPYTNQSLPDTNCRFLPAVGYTEPFYAWCISTGRNTFIIAQQIEMHT